MEEKMGRYFRSAKMRVIAAVALLALTIGAVGVRSAARSRQSQDAAAPVATTPADLLSGFRHVEVASVSDAEEQLLGEKMYMSHRMRPLFPARFAGFALTVELKHQEGSKGAEALAGMLAAIDGGSPDSVYVMVVEDGSDIAGMGGEMGPTMAGRGLA